MRAVSPIKGELRLIVNPYFFERGDINVVVSEFFKKSNPRKI